MRPPVARERTPQRSLSICPGLIEELAEIHAGTSVIVYVDHSAEECGLRHFLEGEGRAALSPEALKRLDDCCLTSLKMNARGCVGTGARPEMILAAIRTVVEGEVAAAPWLASVANVFQGGGGRGESGGLSEREIEIMGLLARGMSNKQIGKHVGIREQTVKNHVTRTMSKLGVDSRLEVGVLAARHNLRLADPEG